VEKSLIVPVKKIFFVMLDLKFSQKINIFFFKGFLFMMLLKYHPSGVLYSNMLIGYKIVSPSGFWENQIPINYKGNPSPK